MVFAIGKLIKTFFCRLIQLLNFSKHRYEFFSPFVVNLLVTVSFFQTISYAVDKDWEDEKINEALEQKLFLNLLRTLIISANPLLLVTHISEDSFNMVLLIIIFSVLIAILSSFFIYFLLLVVEFKFQKTFKAGFLYKFIRISLSLYIWIFFMPCAQSCFKIFSSQFKDFHDSNENPMTGSLITLGYLFAFSSYLLAIFCAFMGRRINFLDGRLNYRFRGTTILVLTGKFLLVIINSTSTNLNLFISISVAAFIILVQILEFFLLVPLTDPNKCIIYCRMLFVSLMTLFMLVFKRLREINDSQRSFQIYLIIQSLVYKFGEEVWRHFYRWIMSVDFNDISLIDRRAFFYVCELHRLLVASEKGDRLSKIKITGIIRLHVSKCKSGTCFCKLKSFDLNKTDNDIRRLVQISIEYLIKITILEGGDKHATAKVSITRHPEEFEFFSFVFITYTSEVLENSFSGLYWLIKYQEKTREMESHSLLFKVVYEPLLIYLEYYTIHKKMEDDDPRREILFDRIDYGSLLIQFHNWEKERMIVKQKLEKIINAKIYLWNNLGKGLNSLNQFLVQSETIVDALNSLEDEHFEKIPEDNHFLYVYILKLYSLFIGRILNNPPEARNMEIRIAEIRRKESQKMHQEINLSTLLSGDIVTVTASFLKNKGHIVYTSTYAWSFFGYAAPQEFQANVTYIESLMPKAISKEHNNLVQRFLRRGTSKILRKARKIVCVNKQNFMFAAKLFLEHNFQVGDDLLMTALILKVKGNSGYILTDDVGSIQAISEEAFRLFKNHELMSLDLIHKGNICLFMPGLVEFFKKASSPENARGIHEERNMKIKCFIPRKVDKLIFKYQGIGIEESKWDCTCKLEKISSFIKKTLYFGSEIFMLSLNIFFENLGDQEESNIFLYLFEITSFAKQKIALEKQEKKIIQMKPTQENIIRMFTVNIPKDLGPKRKTQEIMDWNSGLENAGLQAAESSSQSSSDNQSDFVPPIYHNEKTRQTILIHKVDSQKELFQNREISASPSSRKSISSYKIDEDKEEEEEPNKVQSFIEFEESHLDKFHPKFNTTPVKKLTEEDSLSDFHLSNEGRPNIQNSGSKKNGQNSLNENQLLRVDKAEGKSELPLSDKKGDKPVEIEKPKKAPLGLKLNTLSAKGNGVLISASALKVGKALLNAAFFYGQELEEEDNPKTLNKTKTDLDYNKDELLVEDIQSDHYKVDDLNINRSMTVSTKSGVSDKTIISDITNLSKSRTLPPLLKILISMDTFIILIFVCFTIAIGTSLQESYEKFRKETFMIGFSSEILSPTGFLLVGGFFQLYQNKYGENLASLKLQDKLQYIIPNQTMSSFNRLQDRVNYELAGSTDTDYRYLFTLSRLDIEYYVSKNSSTKIPSFLLSEALRLYVVNGRNIANYVENYRLHLISDEVLDSSTFLLKHNFLNLAANVRNIQLIINAEIESSRNNIYQINQISMFAAVFASLFLIVFLYPIYNRYLKLIDIILNVVIRISEEEIQFDTLILQETLGLLKSEKDPYIDIDFSFKGDLLPETRRLSGKKGESLKNRSKPNYIINRFKNQAISRKYILPILLGFLLILLLYFLLVYFIVDGQIQNFQPPLQFCSHFSRAKTEFMKGYTYSEILLSENHFNRIFKHYPPVKDLTTIVSAMKRSISLFKSDLIDWFLSGTVKDFYSESFKQDLSAILNENICLDKYIKNVDRDLCEKVMSGSLATGLYTALLSLETYLNFAIDYYVTDTNVTESDVRDFFEKDTHLETYIGVTFIGQLMDYYMDKILSEMRNLLNNSLYNLNWLFILGTIICILLNLIFLQRVIKKMFNLYRISVGMLRLIPYHKVLTDKHVASTIKSISKR